MGIGKMYYVHLYVIMLIYMHGMRLVIIIHYSDYVTVSIPMVI